jgi:magnesium-transporting ATPase (P-type)
MSKEDTSRSSNLELVITAYRDGRCDTTTSHQFYKGLIMKDIIEIVESILSIIVSLIAIWGSIAAYQSGFIEKTITVIEHHYENAVKTVDKDL